jgi:hypothetical protein
MLLDETRSLRTVWIELAREKHAGGLQDLIGSAQLGDLTAKGLDLLALLAGQNILAPILVSFCLTDVFAERLRLDAEIPRDVRDRAHRLEHQTHPTVKQLL